MLRQPGIAFVQRHGRQRAHVSVALGLAPSAQQAAFQRHARSGGLARAPQYLVIEPALWCRGRAARQVGQIQHQRFRRHSRSFERHAFGKTPGAGRQGLQAQRADGAVLLHRHMQGLGLHAFSGQHVQKLL